MTNTDHTNDDLLDGLLQAHDIRLGEAQRRRLQWLVARFGAPALHEGDDKRSSGLIILLEPPTGTGAELFCRSLHAGSVVVIPFGENPAFDFLKSKLADFGTVGSCGAEGPHGMWWGGAAWGALRATADRATTRPRIISCHAGAFGEHHAQRLAHAAAKLGLDSDIEPVDAMLGDRLSCFETVEFILRMWRQHREPLLFVDADAVLNAPPDLPATLDCDVALHKWNRWEMSARTIYLGRSDAAEALLRNWQHLAASYPQVWDGYLLDQAWSLTSSQIPLDTVWLPRAYHAPAGDAAARQAAIIHDVPTGADLGPDPQFASQLRASRRAGRTGAGEALLLMTAAAPSAPGVTVILRDTASSDARTIAASVEAVANAFASDSGGFGQVELSLCPWQEDVAAATRAAKLANSRILEIVPGHRLPNDLFRSLARADADQRRAAITAQHD